MKQGAQHCTVLVIVLVVAVNVGVQLGGWVWQQQQQQQQQQQMVVAEDTCPGGEWAGSGDREVGP